MAAPTLATRLSPAGQRLQDGYQTLVTFGNNANIAFWEIEVQPPGIDGGDEINTTTMHNSVFRTFSPRSLYTLTPGTIVVAYDPCVYDEIMDEVNFPQSITVRFPDGATLVFFGYLKSFEPDPLVEGEMPTATVTFVPTNYDPTNCVEAAPVVTCVGTC